MDIQLLVIEYGVHTMDRTPSVKHCRCTFFVVVFHYIGKNLVAIWPEERHDLVALGKQESFQRL